MTESVLFENAAILDGTADGAVLGHVLVEGGSIKEVSDKPIAAASARRIDLRGRTLMPGLIDAHVHVVAGVVNLGLNAMLPDAVVAFRAAKIMNGMLMRGFTTVRDLGGCTHGLRMARDEGHFDGPRLNIAGKALSQTGGHCDFRGRHDTRGTDFFASRLGSLGRLVDGVPDVRRACREEIKAGADYIKIMANGGCASPTDPIAFVGFSREEVLAAVEEAENAETYVSAHLHRQRDPSMPSTAACGAWNIAPDPGTDARRFAAERGAIACPTLVTYQALKDEGASLGLPAESVNKIDDVRTAGLRSLEIMREAGLMMAFGTDLLGEMHRHQSSEFVIRGEVLPAIEVIRSATINAAKLLMSEGKIGCVAPGAYADLVVVEGDPLKDLSLLAGQGEGLSAIAPAIAS